MKILKTISATAATAAVTSLAFGGIALADTGTMYQANLSALNTSESTGTTSVSVHDNQLTVKLRTTGVSPGLPHAQHIHIGGQNTCPVSSADKDKDGFINTVEGQPAYGEVKISLTTTGDVSADSGIAVERFPVASAEGVVTYERTFDLPSGVTANDVAKGVIVQHGISELFDDKAKYDGAKKSSLKPELPLEATIPSSCGKLVSMPSGGGGVGNGSTAGIEQSTALALGGLAVLTAAGIATNRRRFS